MNKKRLSVVMAGAMLASSVAPIMAAEALKAEEIAYSQRGILIETLQNKLNELKYEVGTYAGQSVYGVKVNGANPVYDAKTIVTSIRNAKAGQEIVLVERGYSKDKNGKITDLAGELIEGETKKITSEDLVNYIGKSESTAGTSGTDNKYQNNQFVDKVEWVDSTKKDRVKVTLNVKGADLQTNVTFELGLGDDKLDLSKPLDVNGNPLTIGNVDHIQKFNKFAVVKDNDILPNVSLAGKTKEIAKYVLTNDSANNLLVSDLFDGLMLTEKGNELLEKIKNDDPAGLYYDATTAPAKDAVGIYSFEIKLKDAKQSNKVIETITVKGKDKNEIEILQSWLQYEKFNVGKLAGEDRYATAAKIAKEQVGFTDVAAGKHIVLVNGNALVDGLSAAPLAQALVPGANAAAPVLLTEKNSLPSATKDYIKELIADIDVKDVKGITIDLVGGEGVLSESLVDELKDYGFKVKRYGGETREETSLIVADAIARKGAINNIYVVGAKGEADAMSIAPIASTDANKGAIIVSNFEGLSKDALREIDGYTNANITIVGGDGCVSASDEAKLKEIAKENNKKAERVSGSDRKATNAAIIDKFYNSGINTTNAKAFVIAKDDVLVDALTAANLASKLNAPILLATNELSDEQINQVNLKATSTNALYQVGEGVNTKLVEKLATLFGLPKKATN